MFEHENGILLGVLELLEEKKRLFVVAETPFYTIT
jgi:hypothetical protein